MNKETPAAHEQPKQITEYTLTEKEQQIVVSLSNSVNAAKAQLLDAKAAVEKMERDKETLLTQFNSVASMIAETSGIGQQFKFTDGGKKLVRA